MARRGKPSAKEYAQIDTMIDQGLSDEEIARTINRTVAIVKSRRTKHNPVEVRVASNECIARLHSSTMWKQLVQQLTKEEQEFFEDYWASLIDQFSIQGILATEEMSMKDLILLDILVNRNLVDRRRLGDSIEFYMELLRNERKKPQEERDVALMLEWQELMNGMRAALESITRDFKEYMARKGNIQKELKGTREQRLKTIEESKKNFFELVKLLDEPDMRKKEGDELLVLRLAVANQRERLKNPIKYADGKYDSPLLRPEDIQQNVNAENQEEQSSE